MLFRSLIAAAVFICSISPELLSKGFAADGKLELRYVSGAWEVSKPDGSILSTAGTTTCGLNEAFAYAYPLGLPVTMYGQGSSNKCVIVNATIQVPAQRYTSFHCFGCHFFFDNQSQDGIVFDTQMFSSWINEGAIQYSGTGIAVRFKPTTGLYYASTVPSAPWNVDQIFEIGHIAAVECVVGTMPNCSRLGLDPQALMAVDLNSTCGTNQFTSSAFVLNRVRVNGMEGWTKPNQLFWYKSPACQYSTGGENWFDFGLLQSAKVVEIVIGFVNNNAYDNVLGTNEYRANIAHAMGSGTYAIFSNTIQDRFYLTSMNAYGPATNELVVWWNAASGNRIITQQAFGYSSAIATQIGSTPAWPNVICGYSAATAC
jgi:hypothetical protein